MASSAPTTRNAIPVVDPADVPLAPAREVAPAGTVATAPMPLVDQYDEYEDDAGPGKSMDDWLLEAGAKRDRRGGWYRVVPDTKQPKQLVVEGGKAYLDTPMTRRQVAVGESPAAAAALARAANGTHDSYMPGIGWLRNGIKPEREHPTNVGVIQSGPRLKPLREEIAIDTAEAQKALALKGALQAAVAEGQRSQED
jgi:hypothetical protein